MKLRSYKDLEVWKRSLALISEVYKITNALPKNEQYGLISQMRRAAVSIPSNIAEGYARKGTVEYINFLSMASGSAAELETQLIIVGQEYQGIEIQNAVVLVVEIQKMLYGLTTKLRNLPSFTLPIS